MGKGRRFNRRRVDCAMEDGVRYFKIVRKYHYQKCLAMLLIMAATQAELHIHLNSNYKTPISVLQIIESVNSLRARR